MRFPAWLKTKRQRRVGDTLEVTLELDLTAWELDMARAMQNMVARSGISVAQLMGGAEAFGRIARGATEAGAALLKMQEAVNRDILPVARRMVAAEEVRQAGLEARYYVRGAMDPTYATPEARDAYVRAMVWTSDDSFRFDRAASFLRGWVEHHPEPVCACWRTPESMHFVYYGATEPGSAWEWNPDCPVHVPEPVQENVCATRCQHAEALGAPEWASCADGVDRCSWYAPASFHVVP